MEGPQEVETNVDVPIVEVDSLHISWKQHLCKLLQEDSPQLCNRSVSIGIIEFSHHRLHITKAC